MDSSKPDRLYIYIDGDVRIVIPQTYENSSMDLSNQARNGTKACPWTRGNLLSSTNKMSVI